jgi:hypothetical protein
MNNPASHRASIRDELAYSELVNDCLTIGIRLTFEPLKFEDHRFDPIGAASNKSIFVNHPWTEYCPQHHEQDDKESLVLLSD